MLNDESGTEPLGPRPGQFSRTPPAHTTATTATASTTSTTTSTMRGVPEAAGAGPRHRPAPGRPEPPPAAAVRTPTSAFFHRSPAATRLSPLAVSLFLTLALCIFVVCGRAAANAHSEHRSHPPARGRGLGRAEPAAEPAEPTEPATASAALAASKFVSAHGPAGRHQRDRDRLRRNQLKYLIARTSSGPLGGRAPLERPLQLYKQHRRRSSHADNEIAADGNPPALPESVPPSTRSQPAPGAGRVHRKYAARLQPPVWPDDFDFDDLLGLDAFGRARARDDEDADDDEGESDDDDDEDDDYGAEYDGEGDDNGGDDVADADDDDDADPDDEAPDPADDDYDLDANEQNSIPLDEPRAIRVGPKGANRKLPHPQPWPARSGARLAQAAELGDSTGDRPGAESERRGANWSESPAWWDRARFYERPEPAPFTTASPGHLEILSRRQQQGRPLHRRPRKHMSQPRAPYQSPVVVSISDNSFVSASPVGSGADGTNESPRPDQAAAARYSHIVAGPKNELSLPLGRKGWHDAHIASIHMVQEEPNELRRGGIPSAIIAILFGIGVTGMLIMIVSIKLRSIRERVAYKGRRRSLVPDTDFLINTMPT